MSLSFREQRYKTRQEIFIEMADYSCMLQEDGTDGHGFKDTEKENECAGLRVGYVFRTLTFYQT